MNNSVNNGRVVNQRGLISGLVGLVMSIVCKGNFSLHVENSINNGEIVSEKDYSCGLYCIHPLYSVNVSGTVKNSHNRGNVTGVVASGIANIATEAYNVVNTGYVNGTKSSFSLVNSTQSAKKMYALEEGCISCDNATLLTLGSDGVYYQANSNVRADDLLNAEVIANGNSVMWTSALDLADQIKVTVGIPLSMTLLLAQGDTWRHIDSLYHDTIGDAVAVNEENQIKLDMDTGIDTNIEVTLLYSVTATGFLNETWLIKYGTRLWDIDVLKPFFDQIYAITTVEDKTNCDKSTVVTSKMTIKIYRRSRVSIEIPKTDSSNISSSEIADVISKISGVSQDHFIVVIPVDSKVTRIEVMTDSDQTAFDISNAVNELDKGEACDAGILCKSERSYVVQETSDASCKQFIQMVAFTSTYVVLATVSNVF